MVRAGPRHAARGVRAVEPDCPLLRGSENQLATRWRANRRSRMGHRAVQAPGSEDLCFVTRCTPDEVRAHLVGCGVEIVSGPVIKVGALGPMASHYCHDIDGNLIKIAVYWTRRSQRIQPGRLITMASWVLRAITTSAGVFGSGFSSRCGKCGGMRMQSPGRVEMRTSWTPSWNTNSGLPLRT